MTDPAEKERGRILRTMEEEARKEVAYYTQVIDNTPINKRSALDRTGVRRPLYWFSNRRAEIKRRWGW